MKKIIALIKSSDIKYLILIILVALTTYLTTLRTLPPGIFNDETDIAYEAYSILNTGRDQWGNHFPLQYFSGFGRTRLPAIVYWTVPFIGLFGLNPEGVRMAGIVAGIFVLTGLFFLLRRFFSPRLSMITTLVLIFTPWFWGLTRQTNEAVVALVFIVWGLYVLLLSKDKPRLLILSAILFGLSTYSYYSSQIFVPLFLFALTVILPWLRKNNWKIKIFAVLIFLLMVSPLAIKTLSGGGSSTRLQQTGLFSNVSLVGVLNQKRGDCLSQAPQLWCQAFYNRPEMWLAQFTTNYLNHFSPTFLFGDNWFVGVLPSGNLFPFLLLFGLVGGLYGLAKNKLPGRYIWIIWLFLAPIADSLTGNGHGMRAFIMVLPIVIISTVGWKIIFIELKNKMFRRVVFVVFVGFSVLWLSGFLTDYYIYFPKRYSVYSHYPYRPLINYLLSVQDNYSDIYISNDSQGIMQYSFYLFYSRYDPKLFQQGKGVVWELEPDGWIWVKQIGKWHFVHSLPLLKDIPENSLLIGTTDEIKSVGKPRKIYLINQKILGLQEIDRVNLFSGDTAFVISKIISTLPSKALLNTLEGEIQ